MQMMKYFVIIVAAFSITCQAENFAKSSHANYYNDFGRNPYLTKEMRRAIKPYILPANHPLKAKLDALFLSSRVTQNINTFNEAGFITLFHKPRSFIRVVKHPTVPDYLFKIYLDSDLLEKRHTPGWKWLACRCRGAAQVSKVIKSKNIQHFDVAKKWLYPLPVEPSPPNTPEHIRQPVILAVKDMKLVRSKDNLVAWKTQITRAHLDELYIIIKYAKGHSYRADNIWLSTNGKFCFIDTEYPRGGPDYSGIRPYLNPEMRAYWDQLVRSGGP